MNSSRRAIYLDEEEYAGHLHGFGDKQPLPLGQKRDPQRVQGKGKSCGASVAMHSPHRHDNVLWIGGSPCSGKSSVSALLAERFGLQLYLVDYALRDQMDRINPDLHPTLSRWLADTCDQRWLKPVNEMVDDAIGCYQDHFKMIAEDLASLHEIRENVEQSGAPAILAEGTALLPESAAQYAVSSSRAIWMVPTPAFQLEHYRRRPWVKEMLADCTDARLAFDNWMERDIRFAQWVSEQALKLGYDVMRIDGVQSIEEIAMRVADHFGLQNRVL
jgi:2-phosphoglycerate kinase